MSSLGYGWVGVAPGTTTIRLSGLSGLGTQQCPPDPLPIAIAPNQSKYLNIGRGHGTVRYWNPYATPINLRDGGLGNWLTESRAGQAVLLAATGAVGILGGLVVIRILKSGSKR
jgi:hypothetical protein